MSAIDSGAPESGADSVDGLRRYTTRIKVLVHSHNHADGPINLSDDVMSCQLGKNIKGVGRANIAVVARNSYLNMLYPNDYINIYFDVGDGKGWVRTFFGLIDRVEEDITVAENGVPTTLYHIIATDFQKIFQKTNIYFNPHLFDRPDMSGEDFNAFNIGGVVLMTRGIRVQGSPADMVTNQILLQIGFGSQWKLPDSYPAAVEDRFANQRAQYAQDRLFESVSNLMTPEESDRLRTILQERGLNAYALDTEDEVTSALTSNAGDSLSSGDASERTAAAIQAVGLDRADVEAGELTALTSTTDVGSMARILSDARIRQQLFGSGLSNESQQIAREAINSYIGTELVSRNATNIVDIMNVFDFVERRAIDGYAFDLAIWEKQGPLESILRSVSNEAINELFFDLRPLTTIPEGGEDPNVFHKAGTDWDYRPDEIGGNKPDVTNRASGVRYMPSVVMREYPWATTHRIDASGVDVSVGNNDGQSGNLGIIYFGGIFSNRPNEPGRHLVGIPVLNLEEQVNGFRGPNRTYKHLDVAVISETEIRQTRLGRSDAEHFNLFEMWTEGVSGPEMRYYMYDFLPIITPIHIQRHGLRTRTVTTRFSRYPPALSRNLRPQAETPAEEEVEEAEVTAAEAPREERELVPPVGAHPSLHFRNINQMAYGYRPRDGGWTFHNGIDIYGDGPDLSVYPFSVQKEGKSQGQVDVVAIADGLIVGSMAQGTMSKYGNAVAIYHPQYDVISWYAHLAHREELTGNVDASRRRADAFNREYTTIGSSSRFTPIPVRRGQKIGSVGVTQGVSDGDPNAIFRTDRAHLHFEIMHRVPSRNHDATPIIPYTTLARTSPKPPGSNPYGEDPVEWFASHGVDLEAEIRALGDTPTASDFDEETSIDDTDEVAPTAESRIASGIEDEVSTTLTTTRQQTMRGVVDSIDQRKQIGRWALLQDHWYQHNLEYLSGSVVMRGAPEIRIGYRLDIKERRTSFYVEGVQHSWQYPNEMQTTLQVTRGQPNNPYPAYALPPTQGFNSPPEARRGASRLAHFFVVPDPIAIRRAIALRDNSAGNVVSHERANKNFLNIIDDSRYFTEFGYGEGPRGLLLPTSQEFDSPAAALAEIAAASDISEEEAREQLRAAGLEVGENGVVRTDIDPEGVSTPLSGATEGATSFDGVPVPGLDQW